MDEKALLIVLTIVFLALQLIFHMVTKRSNKEIMDLVDDKFERVLDKFDERTRDLMTEIQSKREGYAASIKEMVSGIKETLIIVNQMNSTQHEISDNMLKISITQKNTSRIQERLEEKLSTHAVECRERDMSRRLGDAS